MKRKLVYSVLILSILLLLTGCSKKYTDLNDNGDTAVRLNSGSFSMTTAFSENGEGKSTVSGTYQKDGPTINASTEKGNTYTFVLDGDYLLSSPLDGTVPDGNTFDYVLSSTSENSTDGSTDNAATTTETADVKTYTFSPDGTVTYGFSVTTKLSSNGEVVSSYSNEASSSGTYAKSGKLIAITYTDGNKDGENETLYVCDGTLYTQVYKN